MILRRILLAIFFSLATLGVLLVEFIPAHEEQPEHPLAHAVRLATLLISAVTAYYFFRSPAHWNSKLQCPRCAHAGTLQMKTLGQPRFSVLLWLFTGFIGALLFTYYRKRHFHCEACGENSDIRTAGGRLAGL